MAEIDNNIKRANENLRTYTVHEVAAMLSIGMTKAYELCASGQFRTIRVGRVLRVVKKSFDEWLEGESL